jgi:hypothetical protein
MREGTVRGVGLSLVAGYAALIGWLYIRQPQTVAEVTGGLSASVGLYRVDSEAFEEGQTLFRQDAFGPARAAFERADPAQRDATTQFFIAYTYYREGWGRLYSDDRLFAAGLAAANRAIALAPAGRLRVDEPGFEIGSADELKAELEAGLRRDASDFNPLRVFGGRK